MINYTFANYYTRGFSPILFGKMAQGLSGNTPFSNLTFNFKEIGNSFYGKMAQGLSDKKSFSFKHNLLTSISPSKITNVVIVNARLTARSIIRASLSELIYTASPSRRTRGCSSLRVYYVPTKI
jgi:hypothetical protein